MQYPDRKLLELISCFVSYVPRPISADRKEKITNVTLSLTHSLLKSVTNSIYALQKVTFSSRLQRAPSLDTPKDRFPVQAKRFIEKCTRYTLKRVERINQATNMTQTILCCRVPRRKKDNPRFDSRPQWMMKRSKSEPFSPLHSIPAARSPPTPPTSTPSPSVSPG